MKLQDLTKRIAKVTSTSAEALIPYSRISLRAFNVKVSLRITYLDQSHTPY